jgi:molybdate transport system substrate-binding protein
MSIGAAGLSLAALIAIAGCGSGSDHKPAVTGSATILAAGPLRPAFTELGKQFESANPGAKVRFRFAPSQALLASVERHAADPKSSPNEAADVLATSDPSVMYKLGKDTGDGNAINSQIFIHDSLEIVTAPGDPLKITGLSDLAKPGVQVVLGRPGEKSGALARLALKKVAVAVPNPIGANDAAGVVAAVAGGKADAGIVYRTDVRAAGGKVGEVPIKASQNVATDYLVALLRTAPNATPGKAFIEFLFSDDAQKILVANGFAPIECNGPTLSCFSKFAP